MKGEKVNLKAMSLGGKLEYICDYYKIQIISALVVVMLIISYIYGQFNKINYVFNVTFLSSGLKETEMYKMEKELTEYVVQSNNKRYVAKISSVPQNFEKESDMYVNIQVVQRFTNQVAASEVDLIILDKRDLKGLVDKDIIKEIEESDIVGVEKELRIKVDDSEKVYGISLEGNKKLQEIEYNCENKVLALCATTKRMNENIKAISWLFK